MGRILRAEHNFRWQTVEAAAKAEPGSVCTAPLALERKEIPRWAKVDKDNNIKSGD